jgi:cytidine deaminase
MTDLELMQLAEEARKFSYCPYSHFAVGAALLTSGGKVYTGCNIENAGYTATNCAERTAFFKAVYDGHRDFTAIALCGGLKGNIRDFCAPCGICRQVMAELCTPDFKILLTDGNAVSVHTLGELLPLAFNKESLKNEQ